MPDEVRKGSISSTISPSSLASTNSIASTSSVPRALVRLLIGHTSQLLPKPTPDGRTHRVGMCEFSLLHATIFLVDNVCSANWLNTVQRFKLDK